MPAFTASAPGKVILFGEHAVVYGRPAVAVPVFQAQARVTITANVLGSPGEIILNLPNIGLKSTLDQLPATHPISVLFKGIAETFKIVNWPAFSLHLSSSIPIAAGMGSGAAVSVAIVRAVGGFLGTPLTNLQISDLAYLAEKQYHGNPSGIDNTVIAFGCPVYFRRGYPFEFLNVGGPFHLIIADTGIKSPTRITVGEVRQLWQADTKRYERIFDEIGIITDQGRLAIESGNIEAIGPLMTRNHDLLKQIHVSCTELDQLVATAMKAGALGAKLCGSGRGGNMIALVNADRAKPVLEALKKSNAVNTILTEIKPGG